MQGNKFKLQPAKAESSEWSTRAYIVDHKESTPQYYD